VAPLRDGTFPHLLEGLAERWGEGRPAFRYKRRGVWWDCSWKEYWERSSSLAASLKQPGVKRGEKVLILGPNALERYFLEMASYFLGAIVISLREISDLEELEGVLKENSVRWAFVRGAKELEQMAEVRERYPHLRGVVFWNYKGVSRFPFSWASGIEDLWERDKGARVEIEGKEEEPCCLLYSAGVTGRPKPSAFSSQLFLRRAKTFVEREGIGPSDVLMPFMPSVRFVDKHFAFPVHLLSGCTIALSEREDTYLQDLKEAKPTVLYFTSRAWERLYKDVIRRIGEGGYLRKKVVLHLTQGGKGGLWGKYLVRKPVRRRMGLERVRRAYNIGPLMGEQVYAFYGRLGIPLRKIYWNSEAGVISVSDPGDGPWDMGEALPGIKVRSLEGRLYVEGEGGEGTQTEDLGMVEGSRIALWGREGEAFFQGGEIFSLQVLKSRLRTETLVGDAFILELEGELYAFLIPEGEALSRWARTKGIQYTALSDLLTKDEVVDLFRDILMRHRKRLPSGIRMRGFCIPSAPVEDLAGFIAINGHWRRGALREHLGMIITALKEGRRSSDSFRIFLFEED